MSAYGSGEKKCSPDGNGCLCGVCRYRKTIIGEHPKGCHGGGCNDCDPDRTEPDDDSGYGPCRECPVFTPIET